jgi:hypothetical protein
MITKNVRRTREIKGRIAIRGSSIGCFYQKIGIIFTEKKLVKCYILSIVLYGVSTWTFRDIDQKFMGSFEIWRWRRLEKISWAYRVRNLRSIP